MDVVFMNCFLRWPNFIFHDKQTSRIKLIPQLMIEKSSTICCFAEVFDGWNDKLSNEFGKYNFKMDSVKKNSGLAIAFNPEFYKIKSRNFMKFYKKKFPDSLVKKGLMHYTLETNNGNEIDVLITHLQCEYSKQSKNYKKYREYQLRQLMQINQYIDKNNLTNYIFAGDVNIDADMNDPLFIKFLQTFDIENHPDLHHMFSKSPTYLSENRVIDYIIAKLNNRTVSQNMILTEKARLLLKDNKDIDYISDHEGIGIKILK